ncbi:hypothetical protein DPMN_182288 [Dreissena polymorpha]|uniref:Uncharacterized protein n=1 Tax=Dreissena polymorpha TaxID=45954 RepID=A0A9D4DFB5_DREPO|nr:hypothetical protein DPMN_182288 [Dreissena polymorpha]
MGLKMSSQETPEPSAYSTQSDLSRQTSRRTNIQHSAFLKVVRLTNYDAAIMNQAQR